MVVWVVAGALTLMIAFFTLAATLFFAACLARDLTHLAATRASISL
jgi:hypothetical protein